MRRLSSAVAALSLVFFGTAAQATTPVLDQLTPENSMLMLIDMQPQFAFSTRSTSIDSLLNNVEGLTEAAQVFKVPTLVTTITSKSFGGPVFPQIQAAAPDVEPIDRTTINAWQDSRIVDYVHKGGKEGRKKIIMAGLWTDNCVVLPALSALKEGYEVYVVTDASGDYDTESHERAVQRLVQAGAVPITWLPVMLEWQADWSKKETAGKVVEILSKHAGSTGLGFFYRNTMLAR
ncbi:hydrolase [Burkholderia ubonensis]|uniref:hydrolase n=1 Tax=Burkholderia ubonensis TaxID=101571 RepID=UPI00075CC7E4|nr:hydrolase [Burkholderia ubonensis]KVO08351.1 hydrolase [Burkholderia ubonensis]